MNTGMKIRFAVSLLTIAVGTATAAEPQPGTSGNSPAGPRTSPVVDPVVDAQALARARAKFVHALSIVDQFKAQAAAARITGDNWRFYMVGNLMQGSEVNFPSVSLARSFADAMNASMAVARAGNPASGDPNGEAASVSTAASVAAGLGTATSDLVYVPITPCRVVDTRAGGPPIPAGAVNSYYFDPGVANVGAGYCSVYGQIPGSSYGAAAFAANVTVDESGITGFVAGSYLQIYPQGGSTGTSFMNFAPNQIIANAGIISLNQANGQFSVVASAPSQFIIDTYGVFIAPQPTALDCVNTANSAPFTLTTAAFYGGTNAPACPAGYTRVSTITNGGTGDTASLSNVVTGDGYAYYRYYGSSSVSFVVAAKCCRVPGR